MKNRIAALLLAAAVVLTSLCSCGAEGYRELPDARETAAATGGTEAETPGNNEKTAETEPETEPVGAAEEDPENTPETAADNEPADAENTENTPETDYSDRLPEYGEYYYDVENVALYIYAYGELPPNYITKDEARELGWSGGSVEDYLEGAAIGGDRFGNYEGLLPEADGRKYTECDIDTDGYYSRGSRRLVFSNDGLFFYTGDHYETFREVTVTEDYRVEIED